MGASGSAARQRQNAAEAARVDAMASGVASGESPAPGPVRTNKSRRDADGPEVQERPAAQSHVWTVFKFALGLCLVLGFSLGVAWGARHYAMTSPRFGIEDISVEGARRLTSDRVRELAGVKVGQNIFTVDGEVAERRLLEDPWVRSARVVRQLPRRLKVELSEHEARAIASIGSDLFLVTRAGLPFKRLESSDPYDIPMITGISASNLARDRAREIDRIKLGVEVLGQYERLPLSHAFAAEELHLAPDGAVTLVVGRQGISMKLGKGPWLMKLRMAERVMGKVQRQGKLPGIIFLDNEAHPERVVVRMR